MENPDYRDRIDWKACLYTYTPQEPPPASSKQDMNYLSKQKKHIKQKKECCLLKKKSKENSLRETGRIPPSPERHSTMCSALQPNRQPIPAHTGGGNHQSEYKFNDHTPHSLSIQAETQARSQDLRYRDNLCRSIPQRGAQHLRQPSST